MKKFSSFILEQNNASDDTQVSLSEAYSFFPKSEIEISNGLSKLPKDITQEVKRLFTFLKKKFPSVDSPINMDLNTPKLVNITRELQTEITLSTIISGAKLDKVKIKYGNGSSGNRGIANRGNLFETTFAEAIRAWWDGEEIADAKIAAAINDLDKTYNLKKSKSLLVNVVGGENTKRPLQFSSNKIVLANTKGSGFDIGESVTDITLVTDSQEIYLSLKLGSTTTFFNVGVKTILTTQEIKAGKIENEKGLNLLKIFGIDPVKFCKVFDGKVRKRVVDIDRNAKFDAAKMTALLQSGIGYGYHIIHKMSNGIVSKQMDKAAMIKAAKPIGKVVVYYGGKTGQGIRVDVEFESASYKFKINIRDTQGKDGFPTRMMCDFTAK
jgi:hypothetical protein